MSEYIKYKIKEVVQSFFYLFEIALFIILVVSLFSKLENKEWFIWINEINTFDFLGKVTIVFGFYQLLNYIFIRLKIAAREDALLSIQTLVSYAQLYNEFDVTLEDVNERCALYLKEEVYMFNNNDYKILRNIRGLTESRINKNISKEHYDFQLKILNIKLKHEAQYNTLAWKNSLLLNMIK